jgi:hypothetical protein
MSDKNSKSNWAYPINIESKDGAYIRIGYGAFVAAFLSYYVNQSILWAIAHFFCGWLYVIYWAIFRSGILPKL